jgi:hypothetical protein
MASGRARKIIGGEAGTVGTIATIGSGSYNEVTQPEP